MRQLSLSNLSFRLCGQLIIQHLEVSERGSHTCRGTFSWCHAGCWGSSLFSGANNGLWTGHRLGSWECLKNRHLVFSPGPHRRLRKRNPQLRLKIRGHFVRKKQGRLPRQREWLSKEQRQEAMGVGRGAASSLGRGWLAKRLQRRLLELCHVLKGPQKEKRC